MAGSALYTAVLDANVLYPFAIRDLLLCLAEEGLFHARWTPDIHHEWVRNLYANQPELGEAKLWALVEVMNRSIPDCVVTGYGQLINSLSLPDPDDRHVLAAAIAGQADTIVTFNLKDFPQAVLAPLRY